MRGTNQIPTHHPKPSTERGFSQIRRIFADFTNPPADSHSPSTGFVNVARMRFTSRRAGTDLTDLHQSKSPACDKIRVFASRDDESPSGGFRIIARRVYPRANFLISQTHPLTHSPLHGICKCSTDAFHFAPCGDKPNPHASLKTSTER